MESTRNPSLNRIELTGTREQLTVQSAPRHSDFPAIPHAQDPATAQDEILTVPAKSPAVQFWRHQETRAGLTLVVLEQEKGHAKTYNPPPKKRQLFDTIPFRVSSADSKLETLRFHAQRYGLTERTAYRYEKSGVDLSDAAAVGLHISGLKHPSEHALDRISKILKSELNTK